MGNLCLFMVINKRSGILKKLELNWAFNFKLPPAILALRVCKLEGGRHIVTCLGAKDFRWPKDLSGGPEVTKQTSGLDKAQPMATVSSQSEGTLVKPNNLKGNSIV